MKKEAIRMSRTRLLMLMLCSAMTSLAGSVVYDNGAPNQQNGNEMSAWIQAEDFGLAQNTTITGISFWTFDVGSGYLGSIWYGIYSDNGGQPGTLLQDELLGSPSRSATGVLVFGTYDEYAFNLAISPFVATGGLTYWLGLHNGPLTSTDRAEVYWETTNGNATATGHEFELQDPGGWSGNGAEHAFQLAGAGSAIPEPSTLTLLGTALAGLGLLRRRRK